MFPVNLKKIDAQTLQIDWDDGHRSLYNLKYLRQNCPCASCNEARRKESKSAGTQFKILSANQVIQKNLTVSEAHVVGRYAISFIWSDGHEEGIYPFELLRSLCQCEICNRTKSHADSVDNQ